MKRLILKQLITVRPECRAQRGVSRDSGAFRAGWFDMACGLLTTNGHLGIKK